MKNETPARFEAKAIMPAGRGIRKVQTGELSRREQQAVFGMAQPTILGLYEARPVFALETADREVAARHILKVLNEQGVDQSTFYRADDGNNLGSDFFRDCYAKTVGNR
jgi:hypothetical protein